MPRIYKVKTFDTGYASGEIAIKVNKFIREDKTRKIISLTPTPMHDVWAHGDEAGHPCNQWVEWVLIYTEKPKNDSRPQADPDIIMEKDCYES